MIEKIQKLKWDLIALALISLTSYLFFYKLGQSSLVSWDEAWYAGIAKNMVVSGNIVNLNWNGTPFLDHPPTGIWLTAISFKLFGISDFTARFASAICGFVTLFVIYFLGKELFNRMVGFTSALGLLSSYWFLYRARSGNLDIYLTMFLLLSLLLALKAVKNKIYFTPFAISLALLFLTKSLVPFTIIPALLIIFWKQKTIKVKDALVPCLAFLVIAGSWFIIQILSHNNFVSRYLAIGYPGIKMHSSIFDNLKLTKEYLHNGIGQWFWPGMLALILGLFTRKKSFYILASFFLIFILPFMFSPKGHIWHLIPLHPILILALAGFIYTFLGFFIKNKIVVSLLLLVLVSYISFNQLKRIWYQYIEIPAYISDEAILSKEAGKYSNNLFIDDDFIPAAVFYSNKNVKKIPDGTLSEFFEANNDFLLIAYPWRLQKAGINEDKYRIIKSDRDKILLQKI